MVRILSIVTLLCLTTYTYGRVERTLPDDSTTHSLTMVSDSATEDVRVGRTLSSLQKCPKVVERFMRREKNEFGNTRCEASDTVSLEDCKVKHRVYHHSRGAYSPTLFPLRKTNDKFVCCWACRIWEQCGHWEWLRIDEDRKGTCRLFGIGKNYEERPDELDTYTGTTRCRTDSGELTEDCGI